MRTLRWLILAAVLSLPWTLAVTPSGLTPSPVVALAAAPGDAPAPAAPSIDVHIDGDRHVVWYANPVVLAVGIGGLALLLIMIALAARGGGTTIIREK